jgi:hypothetical protein
MKKITFSLVLIAVLALSSACGRTPETSATDGNTAAAEANGDAAKLPFAKSGETKGGLFSSQKPEPLTIPSGTPVTVRLQSAVSSETSNAGDRFDAVLDAPLVIDGKTVAPAGAAVIGKVVAARRSGHLKDPGMIQIALSSISIEDKAVPVSSSSVVAKGGSHKKRNVAIIGGSTAGGALLGGLMGGGKGALIGGAVGAGGGTTAAYATGKKDVGFGAERRLTFRLTQAITVHS